MFDYVKGRVGFIHGGRYPHCHTIVITDQKRALIDAASREEELLKFNQEKPVDILITSHAHEDHIMYNYLFPEASFWAHEDDAKAFANIKAMIEPFDPTEEETEMWEEYLIKECNFVPRNPDRLLHEGDVLDFGETTAVVVHTPGHTSGHCAFHFPQERILYMADLDLVKAGPYYGDPGSDLELTIKSLERLATFDVDTYLTAHGKGIHEGNPELIYRYLDTIWHREIKLLDLLAEGPKTIEDIVTEGIIYGKPKDLGVWNLAISEKHMMLKHLRLLEKQGRVVSENGLYHLVE